MSTRLEPYAGRFLVAGAIALFAISQAMPVLVVTPLIRTVDVTPFEFGLTFSLASVVLIFAAPFWGRRSDLVGRRPLVIFGLTGAAIGTLAIALTLKFGLDGHLAGFRLLVVLGFARFVYASMASAIYPSSSGYIADVTSREQRAQGMALLGAANGLGSVVGPLLVATLAFVGVLFPMYVAATLTLTAGLLAWFKLPEPLQHKNTRSDVPLRFTDPRLRPYMICWCLLFMVFMALQIITAFFVQDRLGITDPQATSQSVSIALVAMASMIMLMQGLVLQVFRVHPHVLFRICSPILMVALLVVASSQALWQLVAGFALVGIAFSCAAPGINGSASLSVEAHEQGTAAGFLAAANTLGAILGPLLGTALYSLGPQVPLYVCVVLLALTAIYALTVRPAPA